MWPFNRSGSFQISAPYIDFRFYFSLFFPFILHEEYIVFSKVKLSLYTPR
jgi:hypothetical protein